MKFSRLDMDKSRPRRVVYHATDAPEGLMCYVEEAEGYFNKGYVDSPAKFGANQPKIEVETVKKVEWADASDLSDYLNKEYGLETNFRQGLKKLKEILKEQENDDGAEDN